MFVFKKEQQVLNIAGIKIGGQPGERPAVLAGTIFYERHSIVTDSKKGLFDRKAAEALVNRQEACADETGNPCLVHIYGSTDEAIIRYIDFVCGITDSPLLLDSTEASARIAAVRYVSEVGLADKSVYNSLNMSVTPGERQALSDSDVDASIVLGFNAMDSSLAGRMALLDSGGGVFDRGLLAIAGECGIKKILIDPSITPMGSGAGVALRMSLVAKAKWGLPICSGIHNAPSSWTWLRAKKQEEPMIYKVCSVGSACLALAAAADLVLYGPIENARFVFPIAAMSDIMLAESNADLDISQVDGHPIRKLV